VLGSLPIILLVRRYGKRLLLVFFSEKQIDSLAFLHSTDRLTVIAFILMFVPGTPKDLLTYFLGLTDMKMPQYLLICGAARLPSVITSVVGGDAIGSDNYIGAVIVFALAAVVSIAGLLLYRHITKKSEKQNK